MFVKETLSKAIEMQQKSYLLLQWIDSAMEKSFISPKSGHKYISMAEVAKEWIEEHYLNIPQKCRPEKDDLHIFSNIFSSYLVTSFDLVENPGKILYSEGAHCFCPMCSYLINAPHLQPKKLTKKDKKRAQKLKEQYLEKLSLSLNIQPNSDQIQILVGNKELKEDIAILTYSEELLMRIKGHTEGPALLALWREFAWNMQGSPKKNFKLVVKNILAFEKKIENVIKNTTS
jgi:hypothetical protein